MFGAIGSIMLQHAIGANGAFIHRFSIARFVKYNPDLMPSSMNESSSYACARHYHVRGVKYDDGEIHLCKPAPFLQ